MPMKGEKGTTSDPGAPGHLHVRVRLHTRARLHVRVRLHDHSIRMRASIRPCAFIRLGVSRNPRLTVTLVAVAND